MPVHLTKNVEKNSQTLATKGFRNSPYCDLTFCDVPLYNGSF